MGKLLLGVMLIILSGCGGGSADEPSADNHGYGWEFDVIGPQGLRLRQTGAILRNAEMLEARAQTVASCGGIIASPPPFVIFVAADKIAPLTGLYLSNPPLILLARDDIYEHEVVHYLLDVSAGNADGEHRSPLFTSCS